MRKFYIIENNAGGIEMFVATEDGEKFVGWFDSYEFSPNRLREDITELLNDADFINMWDGNLVNEIFDCDIDKATFEINSILDDAVNNDIILESDPESGGFILYPDRMSSYAKEIFGLEVE